MEYKILSIINNKNVKEWSNIIQNFDKDQSDIYFLPDYIKMNIGDHKHEEGLMFYVYENNYVWINIFIKKKILNFEDVFKGEFYYDLETPYGYGGPISNTKNDNFLERAQKTFFDWCKTNKILCEFVRFHPLINNQIYYDKLDKIIFHRVNRFTKLNLISEKLEIFNPKVRNKIRKALKNNLNIQITKSKKDFEKFKIIYFEHLKNIRAEKFYYFSDEYFKKLLKIIKEFGFILTVTNKREEIIGASIFFGYKKNLHYHLTAISKKNEFPGINNFLLYNAYLYGKKKNYSICNLGGGITKKETDNLLIFKKSMSNNESKFYFGYKIFDKKIYSKLIEYFKEKKPASYSKHKNKILCYRYD